jgi:hypothetical protein
VQRFILKARSFCSGLVVDMRPHLQVLAALLMVVTVAFGSYKSVKVKVDPAGSYPFHMTQGQVTIAADAYETNDKVKTAFDLKDLDKMGIVPVNVIISNESEDLILVSGQDINLLDSQNRSLEAMPVEQIIQAIVGKGKSPPTHGPNPPSRLPLPRKEGLRGDAFEIETDLNNKSLKELRVNPRSTASGFVFFRLPDHQIRLAGHKLYVPQVKNLTTRQDLLFFEVEFK